MGFSPVEGEWTNKTLTGDQASTMTQREERHMLSAAEWVQSDGGGSLGPIPLGRP